MTEAPAAILTFGIGPVHAFIAQARRIADLWAGSAILSEITGAAMDVLKTAPGSHLIFPARMESGELPPGLPNRFVARVPAANAKTIANAMTEAVQERWSRIVEHGANVLARVGIDASEQLAKQNMWREAITTSWSWVPDEGGYKRASAAGARLFTASRVYRRFSQSEEVGTKCAICGERNALPNGRLTDIRHVWQEAENRTKERHDRLAQYFRPDQGRLCLVCAAKRLYPEYAGAKAEARFKSFEEFQPEDENDRSAARDRASRPYFAVVTMDGDRLGERLLGSDQMDGRQLELYQTNVSRVLSKFAEKLRSDDDSALCLDDLVESQSPLHPPQLIYAGGEDVLFVADPRDALPVAFAIQKLYGRLFEEGGLPAAGFTISAAVVFAHSSAPAGALFRDADRLLSQVAKSAPDRNSVAIAIHKRSGAPVEQAFRWSDGWVERINATRDALRDRKLASGQTYDLAEADRILKHVFENAGQWKEWLRYRLEQGEGSGDHVESLLPLIEPFFIERKPEALRIARFIAVEATPPDEKPQGEK